MNTGTEDRRDLDLRGWPGRFCGEGGVLGDGLAAKSVRVAQPREALYRFRDLLLLRNPDTFSGSTREVATPIAEKCRGHPRPGDTHLSAARRAVDVFSCGCVFPKRAGRARRLNGVSRKAVVDRLQCRVELPVDLEPLGVHCGQFRIGPVGLARLVDP